MPTERDPWLSRLPDLKEKIVGFLTFSREPVEMLAILEQFRKHGEVDDQVFELAVAQLLQEQSISLMPNTVKLERRMQ